jgi:hypothetical protein
MVDYTMRNMNQQSAGTYSYEISRILLVHYHYALAKSYTRIELQPATDSLHLMLSNNDDFYDLFALCDVVCDKT